MKQRILTNLIFTIFLICILGLPIARLSAQTGQVQVVPPGPTPYATPTNLTAVQQEGQRMFMQRCSVCHIPGTPTGRVIGVRLTKDLIAGNETAIRQFIMAGTDRMPAFRYALSTSQIDAIIDYLKTGMEATEVDQSGPPPAADKGK
jgi:mono/diheme cytochrome c family protein